MSENRPLIRAREVSLDDLKNLANQARLFAVVDACNVPLAPKKVLELGEQKAISLYRGSAEEEFWEVAPYLMTVDESVLQWLLVNSQSEGWGIFMASKSELEVVRGHLRRFLKVQTPRGEIWHFRFYDPRVLQFFLPICSAAELRVFFGPVSAFGVAGPKLQGLKFWQETTDWTSYQADPRSLTGMSPYFRIRREQEKEFEKYAEQVFLKETVVYVKEQHADKVAGLSDDTIAERVRSGTARARSYGLRREGSILFFLALMFDIAPNFDEQPGIRRALIHGEGSADARMDELLDNTSDEDWDQAEESYDGRKWKATA
jgi:hypothetical protein